MTENCETTSIHARTLLTYKVRLVYHTKIRNLSNLMPCVTRYLGNPSHIIEECVKRHYPTRGLKDARAGKTKRRRICLRKFELKTRLVRFKLVTSKLGVREWKAETCQLQNARNVLFACSPSFELRIWWFSCRCVRIGVYFIFCIKYKNSENMHDKDWEYAIFKRVNICPNRRCSKRSPVLWDSLEGTLRATMTKTFVRWT